MTAVSSNARLRIVETKRKLDVAAGAKREDGWETMDVSPVFGPDYQHDITVFPWPFEDDEFDELRCWHVLEHIERKHLIDVMNEMHRVLKPGGALDIEVPVFPFWTAIADPTHVSMFVPQTFWYFTREMYEEHRLLYDIRRWSMVSAARDDMGSVLKVVMKKP